MDRTKTAGFRKNLTVAALLALLPAGGACQEAQKAPLEREPGGWALTYRGSVPAARTLRINGHGPVTLEGGTGADLRIHRAVERGRALRGRSAEHPGPRAARSEARRERDSDGTGRAGSGADSGESPALGMARIVDSDGGRRCQWNRGAAGRGIAQRRSDRRPDRRPLHGDDGGGDVRVGEVRGNLRCLTGGGKITLQTAHGEAVLETYGAICGGEVAGGVRAQTAAGNIRVHAAGGSVTAITGGGRSGH